MIDIRRHVVTGRIQEVKGIVKIAKESFFVDVEWLYRSVPEDYSVVMITCRPVEWLRLKSALPTLRKEGSVYSV